MSHSNFHIINAAAGSGKTYTLVLYYLQELLGSKSPRPYRQMLALTFTNKAVNEMKSRILEALEDLSKDSPKDAQLKTYLLDALQIEAIELTQRAEQMLRNIVYEYGSFDVITLDKFTHRIVRTFAKEFELPQGFEVVLDTKSILEEVVRSIINQIGEDPFITQLLLKLSLSKVQQGLSWDVQTDLDEFAFLLLNENDRIPLADLKEKDRTAHKKDREQLESTLNQTQENIKNLVEEFMALLNKNNLEPEDFIRQLLHKHIDLVQEESYEKLNTTQLEAMLRGEIPIYKKATDNHKKLCIDELLPDFYTLFLKIKKEVGYTLLLSKTLKYWTPRLILQQIEQGLEQLQNEKEIRLLGEFNHKISSLVQAEEAPYIYARLGERYRHYFLDEFQDTSTLQWSNLVPLIGNALESESLAGEQGSLVLVGDPKQAIYRWRGGDIAQFIRLLNKDSKPFQIEAELKKLEINYRSDEAIVSFNNSFFSYVSEALPTPEIQSIYGETSRQQIKKSGGYVRIKAIPKGGKQEEKIPLYVEQTIASVQQAMDLNYEQKDIAVLVRVRNQAVAIGEGLVTHGYSILSSDSLAVSKSDKVQLIVAVLKLILKPNSSEQHKIIFDQLWKTTKPAKKEYHTTVSNLIHRTTSDFFEGLNTEYGSSFKLHKAVYSPLIQLVDYIVASFPFMDCNDPFVSTFLEDVFEFTRQRGASLINYLKHWETQSQKLTLSTPESLNAIRVMTIHQAKGLEFAVVILPFMDTSLIPNVREKIWYPFHESPLDSVKWGWINFSNKLPLLGKQAEALYNQQKIAKELDALNVLYVALTRAKNQLYVITQTTTDSEQPKTYADLFGSYVRNQGIDLDATSFFESGEAIPKKLAEEHTLEGEKILLEIGISDRWKNHLIAPKVPTEEVLLAQKKGLFIHELLSKITAKEMIDEVIAEEIKLEKVSQTELMELKQTLNRIIDHPDLKQFFDGTDKVLCEQEILIPEGPTLRPDRINISKEGGATILDYKTGQPKIEDKIQLESYVDALNQLGFQKVKSKLVYIDREIEIITIE